MRGFGAGKTVKVRTTIWSDNGRTIDTCDVDRCEGMTLPRLLCDQARRTTGQGDGVIPGTPGLTVVRVIRARGETCCHSGRVGSDVQHDVGCTGTQGHGSDNGRSQLYACGLRISAVHRGGTEADGGNTGDLSGEWSCEIGRPVAGSPQRGSFKKIPIGRTR